MWHDHPLSQRNRTTERTVKVGVGGDREVGKRGQNLKKSRQYSIDLHEIEGLEPFCQLCKETL